MKNHRIAKKFISLAFVALMLLPFPAYATGGEDELESERVYYATKITIPSDTDESSTDSWPDSAPPATTRTCVFCGETFGSNTGHTCTATTYTCACGEEVMQNTYHMHYSITCPDCGESYADYEKHNCQNYATVTCDKCGKSYMDQPGHTHYCPVTCEKCGISYTPPAGHKCASAVCFICGQLYLGASSNHDCPGGKVCDKCGEKYEATKSHTCAATKKCEFCGTSYKSTEFHRCAYICQVCGESCQSDKQHNCPGGVKCAYCGKLRKYTEPHAKCERCGECYIEGKHMEHQKICSVASKCHVCGGKADHGHCAQCGEKTAGLGASHTCPTMSTCRRCGVRFDMDEKHTCTTCANCGKAIDENHVLCPYLTCFYCGEAYLYEDGHTCTKCVRCKRDIEEGELHFCPWRTCVTCYTEYWITDGHTCDKTLCFYCGEMTTVADPCHSECMFCGVVEGSRESHFGLCPVQSCEYCGNGYVGDHSDCSHAPQAAVNGEVTVTVDLRAGKSHIKEFTMTGKVGDSYTLNCPAELLEYHYSGDGKHYTYYKLESIEDHNGGKFIDGMRKIDAWYAFMGRLTEEEARTITDKLPTAGDDLLSPDGQPVLPEIQPAEQQPEVPVVIPPEETEEGEKASVVVMHLDAVTGEPTWFMSILSCPVGGSIELPAADMPGYLFKGFYNSDTGERYGSTYTAQSADTVFLVAEYTYVGDASDEPAPTPTPAATSTPTVAPTAAPASTPTPAPTATAKPTAVPTAEPTPTPQSGPKVNNPENLKRDIADEIARLINQERASRGLPPLEVKANLNAIAEARSEEIVTDFSHESAAGLIDGLGENISMGRVTAQAFVNGWMNSEGHRGNILNEEYDYMGIGVYEYGGRLYAVNVFQIDIERRSQEFREQRLQEYLEQMAGDGWIIAPPLDASTQTP